MNRQQRAAEDAAFMGAAAVGGALWGWSFVVGMGVAVLLSQAWLFIQARRRGSRR